MLQTHLKGVPVFKSSVTSDNRSRNSGPAAPWRKCSRMAPFPRHMCNRFALLLMLVIVVENGNGRDSSVAVFPASAADIVRTTDNRARAGDATGVGKVASKGERLVAAVPTLAAVEEDYLAGTPPLGTTGRLSRAPLGAPAETAAIRERQWIEERPDGDAENEMENSDLEAPAQGKTGKKGPIVMLPAESRQRQRLRRREVLQGLESGDEVRGSLESLAGAEELGKEGKSGMQQEEKILREAQKETGEKEKKAEVTADAQEKEEKERQKVEDGAKDEAEKQLEVVGLDPLLTKEFDVLEKALASEPLIVPGFQHPLCAFANSPWCGGDSKQPQGTPLRSIFDFMRGMNAYFRMVGTPLTDIPFLPSYFWKDELPDVAQPRDECRLILALDPLLPMDEMRLYITLSDRKLGLAANSTVKRSEQAKAYFEAYGSQTRLQAVVSIPEGCLLSKKLVDAGLIGWTYAGQAPDGSKQIVVTFPSLAHAKELQGEQKVSNEAYQALLDEEGLEKVTPMEKCLLSGRTQIECDQMKAEASEAERQVTVPGFSNEGYGENEIRLPRFVYA